MLVDQNTENVTVPLNIQLKSEGKLELANSAQFNPLFDSIDSINDRDYS